MTDKTITVNEPKSRAKKTKKKNRQGGVKAKPINWDQVKGMVGIFCTQQEICEIIGLTIDGLTKRCKKENGMSFSEFFKKYSSTGKTSIRRAQYKKAVEKHDTTMLIWLGKQYLGQTDKVNLGENPNSPFKLNYDPKALLVPRKDQNDWKEEPANAT